MGTAFPIARPKRPKTFARHLAAQANRLPPTHVNALAGTRAGGKSDAVAHFPTRTRGVMSPLIKLALSALAFHSLTRGKGRLAALIAARMGLPGGLASLLTGGAGGAVFGAVLQHLLDALRKQNGPDTLNEDAIQWLMTRTGMTRNELMAALRKFSRGDH